MPRRRRRFSDLERQFRESGGTAAPGSRLAGYIDFKKGINKIEVTKKLTTAERKRYGFAIIPFGTTPEDSTPTRYAAPITAYSNAGRASLNLTDAKVGYEPITGGTEQSENFYPAVLRVFKKTSDTKTTPISGVTKKEYTRTAGVTYSIPFGRTVTAVKDAKTDATESVLDKVDAEDVRKSLSVFLKTQPGVASISYEPEVFKVGKPDLASPPA
ncbi:hypothetical protein [Nostoc sp. CHAB 5715]|uniref:hypothetical protein n=1 Tax=Nostoc sp. CHAB 5715 TaxID=2780400 RepID=UPI001E358386|nr:hypothetical protein [Nostoc sp. CHAB 5715]MCC5620714.1 hypothetical protein [Nostoc sp. CHAB 5715]